MKKKELTDYIKNLSLKEGFLSVGFSKSSFLEEEAIRLEQWIKNGYNAGMKYMGNNFDIRLNPSLLVDNAKTVISLLYNYFPEKKQMEGTYKISKYAYGKDYHCVVKEKLKKILNEIKNKVGDINGRAFTDSAPILEKAWARKSGLGWIGKNSNLITKNVGSFYFIGEIILDIELEYDKSINKDYCGNCNKCIDHCPTNAIESPKNINANKCISYITIESKNEISKNINYKDWIFGCDICQDVCPWNRFSNFHNEPQFENNTFLEKDKIFWEELTETQFKEISKITPLKRAKYYGIKRNINFLKLPE